MISSTGRGRNLAAWYGMQHARSIASWHITSALIDAHWDGYISFWYISPKLSRPAESSAHQGNSLRQPHV